MLHGVKVDCDVILGTLRDWCAWRSLYIAFLIQRLDQIWSLCIFINAIYFTSYISLLVNVRNNFYESVKRITPYKGNLD